MGYIIFAVLALSLVQLVFSQQINMVEEYIDYKGVTLTFSIAHGAKISNVNGVAGKNSGYAANYNQCALKCYDKVAQCTFFEFDDVNSTCFISTDSSFTVELDNSHTVGFYLQIK